ncbi:MAG: hypothetical protein ACPH19_02845 [Flavobacteriaceae bacterium]
MNKKGIALLVIYFFQFIATSCDPCSCVPAKTFERTYNGLELKAWDTSGFQNEEVSGTVNKNSFGLTVSVEFDLNQIAYLKSRLDFSSFGFASAYACSCIPDEYINVDPIEFIEIRLTDTQSQEITDVTANFSTYDYNGKRITISDFFENRADWHDGFQLYMTEYDNIPETSIFEVKIILKSGTELIEQTQEINFE